MEKIENIEDWTNSVITFWKNKNIELNDLGVDEISIKESENLIGFKFSDSFKFFYKKVNGFRGNAWEENMIAIWPLERIVEEYPFRQRSNFIPFADFLICSSTFGFLKDHPGIFKCYDLANTYPEKIADNFEQAIDLINSNAEILY